MKSCLQQALLLQVYVYSRDLFITGHAVAGVQWRSIILTGHAVADVQWRAVYNLLCCCRCTVESCL
jgi:hypothetical protein